MQRIAVASCLIMVVANAVFANAVLAAPELNEQVAAYLEAREKEFEQIPAARKAELKAVADYIGKCQKQGEPAKLLFVCTHNSRRSQLGQVWGAIAAAYYGVPKIGAYSGGTEATAFNARAVAALERAGVEVQKTTDDSNSIYHARYSDVQTGQGGSVLTLFSKVFSQAPNPRQDFCAIMVCSQADKSCPLVEGASSRIAVPYDDPKQSDDSPKETETYDERCRQIAREMLYVMSLSRSPAK
jgi:protein-tyrosine-phosphatase